MKTLTSNSFDARVPFPESVYISSETKILDISENILKNEDERKKISNQLFDEKTLVVYKEIFKLIEKPISYDDFVKLATEK